MLHEKKLSASATEAKCAIERYPSAGAKNPVLAPGSFLLPIQQRHPLSS
jgi:hypothetical protein